MRQQFLLKPLLYKNPPGSSTSALGSVSRVMQTVGISTTMLQAHRYPLMLALGSMIATMALAGAPANSTSAKYFRYDAGIAAATTGRLPDNFDTPEALRWREAIDSGQSTPIVHAGKIFLTTYNNEAKQLATIALDQKTGKPLWKRVVPAPRVEVFHPKTGNAAVATPACDQQRLYVFFESYGLICYDLDGKLLWEHRLGPFQDEYGAGSSPILVDG